MDLTVINDYSRDSMLKGCDEVIDMINKLFGTQEAAKKVFNRKSDSDLIQELGFQRIEKGASRVEDCELFTTQKVEDIEK